MTPSERIDALIASLKDWRGTTLAKLRETILAADPQITEDWKWMGSPTWSRDGIIAVANAHKGKVKITFDKGAHLPDPHRLFNAGLDGNKWRAIDLLEGQGIDEAAFRDLVRAAVDCNRSRKTAAAGGKTKTSKPSKTSS